MVIISTKDEELDIPSLNWIPTLHKCPYKYRYIGGSAKLSTLYETSFQIINVYSISGQNQASEFI